MFLNQRSRRIAALIVTVFLLAALPAAAGFASPEMRAPSRPESIWDGFLARALAWLGSPWGGASSTATSAGDSGSQIDPLG
jgi:hypothetical protein